MHTPDGRVILMTTAELEPTPDGTIVRMRFAAPKDRKQRAIFEQMAPMFEGLIRDSQKSLESLLAEESDRRSRDRSAVPDLPAPKPDAPFAGVLPIRMLD